MYIQERHFIFITSKSLYSHTLYWSIRSCIYTSLTQCKTTMCSFLLHFNSVYKLLLLFFFRSGFGINWASNEEMTFLISAQTEFEMLSCCCFFLLLILFNRCEAKLLNISLVLTFKKINKGHFLFFFCECFSFLM